MISQFESYNWVLSFTKMPVIEKISQNLPSLSKNLEMFFFNP